MLKEFTNFFKSLNNNSHPGEIAHAICTGMILGFMPKGNALWFILTIIFLFLRINKGAFVLSTLCFTLLSPFLDPFFDYFGYWILTLDPLSPFFSALLEIPFVGFTKFNNSIVMGSLISSLILYIPVYFLSRLFLKIWRATLAPIVKKSKLITVLSKIPLIRKISEMV